MKSSKRILLVGVATGALVASLIGRREYRRRAEFPKIEASSVVVRQTLKKSLVAYRIQMGDYPSTEEGLVALVRPPEKRKDRWKGPYLDGPNLPVDAWGKPYQYRYPGLKNSSGYDLWSLGPDRIVSSDDIANWPK